MAEEKGVWRTINGVHVFIREGETPTDALNRTIAKKNEDTKAEQIAKNQKKADKLNGKSGTITKTVHYFAKNKDGKSETHTVQVTVPDTYAGKASIREYLNANVPGIYQMAVYDSDKDAGKADKVDDPIDLTENKEKKSNNKSSETEEFDVEYWTTYNGHTAKQYARVTGNKDDMYEVRDYIKKYIKDNDLGELSHLDIGRKGSGSAKEEQYAANPMYTSQFKVKDSRPLNQIAQDYIKKYKLAKGESKIPLAVIKKDIAKLDLSEKDYTKLLGMIVLGV